MYLDNENYGLKQKSLKRFALKTHIKWCCLMNLLAAKNFIFKVTCFFAYTECVLIESKTLCFTNQHAVILWQFKMTFFD